MTVDTLQTDEVAPVRHTGLGAYATACAGLVAVIFLTNWPSYQYEVRGGLLPLYYYLLPVALIVPMVFAEPPAAMRVMREPLFWWFVVFVVSGLIWLLLAQDIMEDASRQWRLRGQAILIFYTAALLALYAKRRLIGWIILGCCLLACAFNWIDVIRPYRFVPEGIEGASEGRGAGLFINPNAAGSFVVMSAIAMLPYIPKRLRGVALVAAVFGVAATFSRGAFVMITVAIAGALVLKLVTRGQGMLLVLGLPVLVTGVTLSYNYLIDVSESRNIKTVIERLNWFSDNTDDAAVEGRKWGAAQAWRIFLEDPLTGKGPGATSTAMSQDGPHNMYLLLMAEQGVLGLVLYVSLWALLIGAGRRAARYAPSPHERDAGNTLVLFGVFMATYGFFSHNVLEEPFTVFLLGFVVAGAVASRRGRAPLPAHLRTRPAGARRITSAV